MFNFACHFVSSRVLFLVIYPQCCDCFPSNWGTILRLFVFQGEIFRHIAASYNSRKTTGFFKQWQHDGMRNGVSIHSTDIGKYDFLFDWIKLTIFNCLSHPTKWRMYGISASSKQMPPFDITYERLVHHALHLSLNRMHAHTSARACGALQCTVNISITVSQLSRLHTCTRINTNIGTRR